MYPIALIRSTHGQWIGTVESKDDDSITLRHAIYVTNFRSPLQNVTLKGPVGEITILDGPDESRAKLLAYYAAIRERHLSEQESPQREESPQSIMRNTLFIRETFTRNEKRRKYLRYLRSACIGGTIGLLLGLLLRILL